MNNISTDNLNYIDDTIKEYTIRSNPENPKYKQIYINGKWENSNILDTIRNTLKSNTDAKADTGKLQISLVPMEIVRAIARIRMYGNEKYHSPSNWTKVEKRRYIDAMMRHLLEYLDNEDAVDSESGLPALWHAACNMAFICEMQRKDWDERKKEIVKGFADIEGK